jgi:hypothetical protein
MVEFVIAIMPLLRSCWQLLQILKVKIIKAIIYMLESLLAFEVWRWNIQDISGG